MQLENSNTNNNNSSTELLESEEVPGTTFKITGNKNTGYYLTMGKYILTKDPTDDKNDLRKLVAERDWNLINTVIATITEHIINAEQQNQTINDKYKK